MYFLKSNNFELSIGNNQSRNLNILSYSNYKQKFQENIDYYIFSFIIIVLTYRFISSIYYIFKKREYSLNLKNKEYNIPLGRRGYLKILELFVYYAQIISLLTLFDLNNNNYNNLKTFTKKIHWINLFDINIVEVSNRHCKVIDFYFKSHFIFIIGIALLSFINILISFIFSSIYKYKLKLSNEIQLFANLDATNNSLINIYKDDYFVFPNISIQFILFSLLSLITTEALLINRACKEFFVFGQGLMLVVPFLFSIYIIATIKNKINVNEELTFNNDSSSFITKFKKSKSIIDMFNSGYWNINTDVTFCKSHFPVYIDLLKTQYMYIHLLKNFILGITTGISTVNKIGFGIFTTVYIIDSIIIIIVRPYNNKLINFIHLLTNISLISTFLSILISEKDKYAMYIVTFTLISYIIIILIEMIGLFLFEIISIIRKIIY
jgi:hypothetical protein